MQSLIVLKYTQESSFFLAADGHGGAEVADHCREMLHKHFAASLSACRSSACGEQARQANPGQGSMTDSTSASNNSATSSNLDIHPYTSSTVTAALRSAFLATDNDLLGTDAGEFVGATAVVAVVGISHIWVAHCGTWPCMCARFAAGCARFVAGCAGSAVWAIHAHDPALPCPLQSISPSATAGHEQCTYAPLFVPPHQHASHLCTTLCVSMPSIMCHICVSPCALQGTLGQSFSAGGSLRHSPRTTSLTVRMSR